MSPAGVNPTPRRSAAETGERILEVATELFYWHGIRATGVDAVAAGAGVAPPTLYRQFASKDELVAAYLRRNDAGYRRWLLEATGEALGSPRRRLLGLFDALEEQTRPEVCRGCPYQQALAEFPDPAAPVHQVAVATKAWVHEQVGLLTVALAEQEGTRDPGLLADQLVLLMEGVYASVAALGHAGPARSARRTAEMLLDAARPATRSRRKPDRQRG